ncbi:MAG TPA: TIGR03118 family protein [Burkholderiales bacterium]|nr:TIGR03118 family protein [Burkholderiales bacterium]
MAPSALAQGYKQTNLVTDDQAALAAEGFGPALTVDSHLINPWGIAVAPGSPFWVSNQGTSTSTLYTGAGQPLSLVVDIPSNPPVGGPTGQTFNPTNSFALADGNKGSFFFANLDGSISGWNPGSGTTAQRVATTPGAVYTGIAIGTNASGDFLFAANNSAGRIDVFDSSFAPTTLPGGFVDPNLPSGLAPFNVANIGGRLLVTYAVPGPAADAVDLGSGLVDEFDTNGNFVRRLVAGGALASPWGLVRAPSDFGQFSNALLVGNFNDEHGNINAYDFATGMFLGSLTDPQGDLIALPDLWGLIFGNGSFGGRTNELFFTAGIGDEQHGLFGKLEAIAAAVPEPSGLMLVLNGLIIALMLRRRMTGS